MTLFKTLTIGSAVSGLLVLGTVSIFATLPALYRNEAIQLCNITNQPHCEAVIDNLHSQTGESYKSLWDLERELNKLPPAAQSSRQTFRELAILLANKK